MGFFSVGTSEAKCDVVVRQSQTTAPRHLQFYDKRLKTDILSLLYLKRDLHECDDALVNCLSSTHKSRARCNYSQFANCRCPQQLFPLTFASFLLQLAQLNTYLRH